MPRYVARRRNPGTDSTRRSSSKTVVSSSRKRRKLFKCSCSRCCSHSSTSGGVYADPGIDPIDVPNSLCSTAGSIFFMWMVLRFFLGALSSSRPSSSLPFAGGGGGGGAGGAPPLPPFCSVPCCVSTRRNVVFCSGACVRGRFWPATFFGNGRRVATGSDSGSVRRARFTGRSTSSFSLSLSLSLLLSLCVISETGIGSGAGLGSSKRNDAISP